MSARTRTRKRDQTPGLRIAWRNSFGLSSGGSVTLSRAKTQDRKASATRRHRRRRRAASRNPGDGRRPGFRAISSSRDRGLPRLRHSPKPSRFRVVLRIHWCRIRHRASRPRRFRMRTPEALCHWRKRHRPRPSGHMTSAGRRSSSRFSAGPLRVLMLATHIRNRLNKLERVATTVQRSVCRRRRHSRRLQRRGRQG